MEIKKELSIIPRNKNRYAFLLFVSFLTFVFYVVSVSAGKDYLWDATYDDTLDVGSWDGSYPAANTRDNNFATYGRSEDSSNQATVLMNFSKPVGYVALAYFHYKLGDRVYNKTGEQMDSECLDGSNFRFRGVSNYNTDGPDHRSYGFCLYEVGTSSDFLWSVSGSSSYPAEVTYFYDGGVMWEVEGTDPPELSGCGPSSGTDGTPTFECTADENAWCRMSLTDETYDGMSNDIDCSGDGTTSISCVVSPEQSVGAVTYYIACKDTYDNKDTVSSNEHHAYERLDNIPPVVNISNPLNQTYTGGNVGLNYSVFDNLNLLDSVWYNFSSNSTPVVLSDNITLFLNDSSYHLFVCANDTSYNIGCDNVSFEVTVGLLNPFMYVEDTPTWNHLGYFSDPETVSFTQELKDALNDCTADEEGYCNISLNFSSDSIGNLDLTDLQIFYTPIINNAPVWNESIVNITVNEDNSFAIIDSNLSVAGNGLCSDADGDALNYSIIIETVSEVDISLTNNDNLSAVPANNFSGESVYRIRCDDSISYADVDANVTITPINDLPWWDYDSVTNQSTAEDSGSSMTYNLDEFSWDVEADINGVNMTYGIDVVFGDNNASGTSCSVNGAELYCLNEQENRSGDNILNITALDSDGAMISVFMNISTLPLDDIPWWDDITNNTYSIVENNGNQEIVNISTYFRDVEDDKSPQNLMSPITNASDVSCSYTNDVLYCNPVNNYEGSFIINITAQDSAGISHSITQNFEVMVQSLDMSIFLYLNESEVMVDDLVEASGKLNLSNGTDVAYNPIYLSYSKNVSAHWYDNDTADSFEHDFRFPIIVNTSIEVNNLRVVVSGQELIDSTPGLDLSNIDINALEVIDPDALPDESNEANGDQIVSFFRDKDSDNVFDPDDYIEFNLTMLANTKKLVYLYDPPLDILRFIFDAPPGMRVVAATIPGDTCTNSDDGAYWDTRGYSTSSCCGVSCGCQEGGEGCSECCPETQDGGTVDYFCDVGDTNYCFYCADCSGVTKCSSEESNECDADCGADAECDDKQVNSVWDSNTKYCFDCEYVDSLAHEVYSKESKDDKVSLWLTGSEGNYSLTLKPKEDGLNTIKANSTYFSFYAEDSEDLSVSPFNNAPSWEPIDDWAVDEDETPFIIDLSLNITDVEDNDTLLEISWEETDVSAVKVDNINNATDEIQFSTIANKTGSNTITLTLVDTEGLTATETFTITVSAINDAPWWDAIGNDTASNINEDGGSQQVLANYTVFFRDVEDDQTPQNPQISTNETDVTCSESSTAINCTPVNNFTGDFIVILSADDSSSQTITQSFEGLVTSSNDIPWSDAIANPANIDEDSGLNNDIVAVATINNAFRDVEEDQSLTSCTIDSESDTSAVDCEMDGSYNVDCTTVTNKSGSNTVILNCCDSGAECTNMDSFTVTVDTVNDAPWWDYIANNSISIVEDSGSQLITNISTYFRDVEDDQAPQNLMEPLTNETDVSCSYTNDQLHCDPTNSFTGSFIVNITMQDSAGISHAITQDFEVNVEALRMNISLYLNESEITVNDFVEASGKLNLSNSTNVPYNLMQLGYSKNMSLPWYDNDTSDGVEHEYRFPIVVNTTTAVSNERVIIKGQELVDATPGLDLSAIDIGDLEVIDPLDSPDGANEVNGNNLTTFFRDMDSDGIFDPDDYVEFNITLSENTQKLVYLYDPTLDILRSIFDAPPGMRVVAATIPSDTCTNSDDGAYWDTRGYSTTPCCGVSCGCQEGGEGCSECCPETQDGGTVDYFCDVGDTNNCFYCADCSGVTKCSSEESNECDADCGADAECDDKQVNSVWDSNTKYCLDCSYVSSLAHQVYNREDKIRKQNTWLTDADGDYSLVLKPEEGTGSYNIKVNATYTPFYAEDSKDISVVS